MVYNVLKKLEKEDRLENCSITVPHEHSVNNKKTIFGRNMVDFDRSSLKYEGGETGYEKFAVPLESVLEVKLNGKTVYRKKKAIKRIYPRS